MQVYVDGIGILGPGLAGWEKSHAVLAGEYPYTATDQADPEPTILPPNELRRSSQVVRWALAVAEEALPQAQTKANEVAIVFASSGGENAVWHQLCTALASPERIVSPTLFHHSVHNAAAGYWSIGTGSTQPSTSLACYDSSFCAGLLEAAAQVIVEEKPVMLVVYDLPPPQPIYAARPLVAGFSGAMILMGRSSPCTKAQLNLTLCQARSDGETKLEEPGLERLRIGNPAARALPLLAAIAKGGTRTVRIDYLEGSELWIEVTSCHPCPSKN